MLQFFKLQSQKNPTPSPFFILNHCQLQKLQAPTPNAQTPSPSRSEEIPIRTPINRLGSTGGKTTVSHAQVSLVEASKGVRFPLRPKGLVPPGIPGQGSAIPREGLGESCFRGGMLKGCALWVRIIPTHLSPFCKPPPPHVSYLPVGFLTRLRKT